MDLNNYQEVRAVFELAADANLRCPLRRGSAVYLPPRGRLIMTGDLHDHGLNLERILSIAALEDGPEVHLVLHEVIHSPRLVNGCDLSVRTLARVAMLKTRWPQQVHVLLGNHELAQWSGQGIAKGGVNVVEAFDAGIEFIYAEGAPVIREAVLRFIRSLPLAVRCANGLFCAHSVPSPHHLGVFDWSILDRVPSEIDMRCGGAAHSMVWGRRHTQESASALAAAWGCKRFLLGHQPAEMGYSVEVEGGSILILASDHDHGVALPLDLSREYAVEELVSCVVPLASVML